MSKKIICGNVLKILPKLNIKFNLLIADPPDGINIKYNSFNDKTIEQDYSNFLEELILLCMQRADISWISFNAKWIFKVGAILEKYPNQIERKLFINTFTFGQNNNNDCGNGFRPILRLKTQSATLYPDKIKVPSWRQLNGDKRATEGGRVPLDVWDFPRITGNCKERRSWHPTQHREAMIKRIIDFSTKPGDTICDAFSGTGTVLRACNDRDIHSIEIDRYYCEQIAQEHNLTRINKNLWSD